MKIIYLKSNNLLVMPKSIYRRYNPLVTPKCASNTPNYWFIFNHDKLLINPKNELKLLFTDNLKNFFIFPIREHYLGTLDSHDCYVAEVMPETSLPEGMAFEDLKQLYHVLDEDIFILAGRAIQIINWDKDHQFCGKCGTPTQKRKYENAKKCPECGHMEFPRLSPAVITAIVKDGKLLMAKHSYGLKDRYSLIAGFVEPGETIEEAVERETMEEVGLKVKNVQYFGSQPWPFPHSLMLAFTAEYENGEIKVDEKEIVDADWFYPDEIRRMPSKISIASELIEWFILNYKKK